MKNIHNLEKVLNHWVAYDATGYSVRCLKRVGYWIAFHGGQVHRARTLTELAATIGNRSPTAR